MFKLYLQFLAAFLHFPLALHGSQVKCLRIYGSRLKSVWDNNHCQLVCVGSNIFCNKCHVVFDMIVKLFFFVGRP